MVPKPPPGIRLPRSRPHGRSPSPRGLQTSTNLACCLTLSAISQSHRLEIAVAGTGLAENGTSRAETRRERRDGASACGVDGLHCGTWAVRSSGWRIGRSRTREAASWEGCSTGWPFRTGGTGCRGRRGPRTRKRWPGPGIWSRNIFRRPRPEPDCVRCCEGRLKARFRRRPCESTATESAV